MEPRMKEKLPEEFNYEYLVLLDRDELASYFTDAIPRRRFHWV